MVLSKGQRVIVSGEDAGGPCRGEVIHAEEPATMPSINAPEEIARVREIMAEWGIVEVAMIEYLHNRRPVVFAALRDKAGVWRDLKRQRLTITPLHG